MFSNPWVIRSEGGKQVVNRHVTARLEKWKMRKAHFRTTFKVQSHQEDLSEANLAGKTLKQTSDPSTRMHYRSHTEATEEITQMCGSGNGRKSPPGR